MRTTCNVASIQNHAGNFVNPSIRNVAGCGRRRDVGSCERTRCTSSNPPKTLPTAYPISTYTYIILPTKSANATELRKLVFWALTQGQAAKYTARLWFAPIPKVVLAAAEKTLKQIQPVVLRRRPPRPGVTEARGRRRAPSRL